MKALFIVTLGIALSACVNGAAKNELASKNSYLETSLLFGDEPTPVKSHKDCEGLGDILCFDVGTYEPFQIPASKSQLLAILTKNDDGPFGVEGQWKNGKWEYDAYRRETEFYGLTGDFFWVMTYFNDTTKRMPINLTIFSYEHGLLLNVPVREVMGIDAPIIVPGPIITTYKEK